MEFHDDDVFERKTRAQEIMDIIRMDLGKRVPGDRGVSPQFIWLMAQEEAEKGVSFNVGQREDLGAEGA